MKVLPNSAFVPATVLARSSVYDFSSAMDFSFFGSVFDRELHQFPLGIDGLTMLVYEVGFEPA